MKYIFSITFVIFLFSQSSFSQQGFEIIPYGFEKLQGLEYVGKIYFYHNKKTQSIIAYQNNKIKWQKNVITTCGKPSVGKPKIREFGIRGKYFEVVYGKHSFAKIEVETGNVICDGAD